jgi:hypothetical protein
VPFINRAINLASQLFGAAEGTIGAGSGLKWSRYFGLGRLQNSVPAAGKTKHEPDEAKQQNQDEQIDGRVTDRAWFHGATSPGRADGNVLEDTKLRGRGYATAARSQRLVELSPTDWGDTCRWW